jgi:hypothetical protein
MADLHSKYRPVLEGQLGSGEELRGLCIASQQKGMFKGGAVAIGVTDRRLVLQPLDRRGAADGTPRSISPSEIASAKAGPAGGGWIDVDAAILDHAAVGEPQRQGLEALAGWFRGTEAT